MTSDKPLRIGTRGSLLAMAQSRHVADALAAKHPGLQVELVSISTRGDRTAGPLAEVGGKGLFTADLEAALLGGEIDLAVHSAKDLPAAMSEEFVIAAVPPRADARDALISSGGGAIEDLPPNAVVGTGSPRRAAQLRAIRGDLQVESIRGNVDTRLRRVLDPPTDRKPLGAVVLAMAGLDRSGLLEQHAADVHPLAADEFIPAAGQGALVVQAAAGNVRAMELAAALDDESSRRALEGERMILHALSAQCRSCIAVHIAPEGKAWGGRAMAARDDGGGAVGVTVEAPSAAAVAAELLDRLRRRGAEELLRLDR